MRDGISAPSMQRTITHLNKFDEHELFLLKKRLDLVIAVIIICLSALMIRLWFLQVHKGFEFKEQSQVNRIQELRIIAPRGNIHDRNGDVIVTNRPSFNVVLMRGDNPRDEVIKKLARILDLDISIILDRIRAGADTPKYIPIRLKEDIDWKTLVYIENNHFNLPGVRIEVLPIRDYKYGDLASHLIGYLGSINRDELEKSRLNEYEGGDLIGKQGLEKLLERQLRGERGRSMLEVNARGLEKRQLAVQQPLPGNDVYLTIDAELQKTAEETMTGKAGSVIAMEVNTGRILAMASTPPLALEEFVGGISQKAWEDLLNNPLRPLVNKSIQGQYPPASTYKIVTALSGLMEGVITPESTFTCNGIFPFGNRKFRCWKKSGHGSVDLNRAIAESCDIYFYQLSQKLNVDIIAEYAKKIGLGQETGIILEHEKSGLIPTSAWKERTYREKWQDGETLSISIGQGFNLATPLQVTRMIAAIANGGDLYRPQLVEKIVDPEGEETGIFSPILDGRMTIPPDILSLIRKGLVAAVNGKHATGEKAHLTTLTVAGKTGTAQVVHLSQVEDIDEENIPYKYRDHAWFTCYAPAENPVIAVTALVEHGGHGGSAAGPVARQMLMKYFNITEEDEKKAVLRKKQPDAT
ncbi:MAG: penicillin-binding protein 2 [Proteobacteria bacterium]|nr:penicillin-binding protein 2 [Pseudomonadota bacterium]MBU1737605.1 penicillin-binding protein 2 [Pseudomonadota bacterium]